jgi:hypothetical protein
MSDLTTLLIRAIFNGAVTFRVAVADVVVMIAFLESL